MTTEAVKHSDINANLKDTWRKLFKRLEATSKRRNRVAHSIVMFDLKRAHTDRAFFLAPNVSDPKRAAKTFARREIISEPELEEMINEFGQLYEDLMTYHQTLPPRIPQP